MTVIMVSPATQLLVKPQLVSSRAGVDLSKAKKREYKTDNVTRKANEC